jgi:chemosensory pili system protein ChpB (putative protein-glutamate methylesterase)
MEGYHKPRVAIGCDSERRRGLLHQLLESQGLKVTIVSTVDDPCLLELGRYQADVLLIDLDQRVEYNPEALDALMEQAALPVLFNDGVQGCLDSPKAADGSTGWQLKLVQKLILVARQSSDGLFSAERNRVQALPKRAVESNPQFAGAFLPNTEAVEAVWVLGASVGGPQAVKRFLGTLPAELPVALILVQHIGNPFISLLAEQLDRASPLSVVPAREGLLLRPHQVVVAPVQECLMVGPEGHLKLRTVVQRGRYRPSIDAVMTQVAERFKNRAGAIIFSGMGDDGTRGCRAVTAQGGVVWAQDAESCFISSMPDHARATGRVSYSGSPEILARRLGEHLGRTPEAAHSLKCR